MTEYFPTRSAQRAATDNGFSWAEVVEDLSQAGVHHPLRGYETRIQVTGERIQALCEAGFDDDGFPALFVIGLCKRRESAPVPLAERVVGVEPKVQRQARKGGVGTRWPTSWDELIKRLRALGHEVTVGGKHMHVLRAGKRVATMPLTASDHRSLVNMCRTLERVGIDVRRAQ